MLAKPSEQAAGSKGKGLFSAYGSTFLLTLTNPLTILSFVAIFAGLGLAGTGGQYAGAGVLVLGVFMGSAFWWLLLSTGVGLFREKFRARGLQWVNWASGAILLGFGLYAIISAL